MSNILPKEDLQASQLIQNLGSVLRIIKQRQQNYFKLLDFIRRNLQGLTNQTEQITIVNIFLRGIETKQKQLQRDEEVLINQYKGRMTKSDKLIVRLSARIFEIFQGSLLKIRNTCFYDDATERDYKGFQNKIEMHNSDETVQIGFLVKDILDYSKSKYRKEINKVNSFLERLEEGEHLFLREYYDREEEDNEKETINQDCYPEKPVKKKRSVKQKKLTKDTAKYREKKDKQSSISKNLKTVERSEAKKMSKLNVVNKLMKLYSVIDPSRVQFMEDLVYDEVQQQKTKLTNVLVEKNKEIGQQINEFYKKMSESVDRIKYLNENQPKSDVSASGSSVQRHKSTYFRSQSNIKSNFIISKSKNHVKNTSFLKKVKQSTQDILTKQNQMLNSAGEYSSGAQYLSDNGGQPMITQRKPKHSGRRPISKSMMKGKVFPNLSKASELDLFVGQEQKEIKRSKEMKQHKQEQPIVNNKTNNNRVFVVKSPTLFQDQNLNKEKIINSSITGIPYTNTASKPGVGRKNSKMQIQQKIIKKRPSTKKVVSTPVNKGKEQLLKQKSGQIEQRPMIFDAERIKRETTKKQFNLRLKKHNKKSVLISQKMFIEQTNEQINKYNFPG